MADTTPSAGTVTVKRVDPKTLLVDANVRLDPALDKDFCASIAEHGVLVPIVAVRTPDGGTRVRFGHRRALAAAAAGNPDVPVVITGDDDADTAGRIVQQWAENEHRSGLSAADKIAAIEQLAAFGLTPTQIARRTKTRKADVDAALAAAGSDLAKAAAGRYDFLDLTQAAVLGDFADDPDDDPEAVKALVAAAKTGPGQFDHIAQRSRDARESARATTALGEQLTADGLTVIEAPRYDEKTIPRLRTSRTTGSRSPKPRTRASRRQHRSRRPRGWHRLDPEPPGPSRQDIVRRHPRRGRAGSPPARPPPGVIVLGARCARPRPANHHPAGRTRPFPLRPRRALLLPQSFSAGRAGEMVRKGAAMHCTAPADRTRCTEPGCPTQIPASQLRRTPHAEARSTRGHRFERAPLPLGAPASEVLTYRATRPAHQRCRHCGGRRSLHDTELPDPRGGGDHDRPPG